MTNSQTRFGFFGDLGASSVGGVRFSRTSNQARSKNWSLMAFGAIGMGLLR